MLLTSPSIHPWPRLKCSGENLKWYWSLCHLVLFHLIYLI
jgi:hypothetical protein